MANKFQKGTHFCFTPFLKTEGKTWRCRKCGAVYTCKMVRGRLTWLMTRDGRQL